MKMSTVVTVLIVIGVLCGGLYLRYHNKDTDARGATRLMRSIENHAELADTARLIERSKDINIRDKSGKWALPPIPTTVKNKFPAWTPKTRPKEPKPLPPDA